MKKIPGEEMVNIVSSNRNEKWVAEKGIDIPL